MLFGLTNAPATFQHFMQIIFAPYLGVFIEVFLDDFCIYSTRQEHLTKVHMAFHRIDEAKGNNLNPKNCMIEITHEGLLGHIVSAVGIRPDPKKVDAILKLPPPSTKHQVRSFVNLARYYRHFMDGYAAMTRPITLWLKDNTEFYWNEECDSGFTQVKDSLASESILCNPNWST